MDVERGTPSHMLQTCPLQCGRFIQKKYKTLISLSVLTMETLKGLLSPDNWLFPAKSFEWTAHSVHVIADACASGPALSRAIHSVRHITKEVLERGDEAFLHNFRKIRVIAFECFSLIGDACQIAVGLDKLGIIHVAQHVPGLQVAASVITSIASVIRISNAYNNKKFTAQEKVVVIAKEITSIALAVLLVIAISTQPHIIMPLIIGTSFGFLLLDLLEYAFVKKEKESLYTNPDPA